MANLLGWHDLPTIDFLHRNLGDLVLDVNDKCTYPLRLAFSVFFWQTIEEGVVQYVSANNLYSINLV